MVNYQKYMKSEAWKERKKVLFLIHGRKCKRCGTSENLNIHHLSYKNLGEETEDDVIVLCRQCHKKWHKRQINDIIWKDNPWWIEHQKKKNSMP